MTEAKLFKGNIHPTVHNNDTEQDAQLSPPWPKRLAQKQRQLSKRGGPEIWCDASSPTPSSFTIHSGTSCHIRPLITVFPVYSDRGSAHSAAPLAPILAPSHPSILAIVVLRLLSLLVQHLQESTGDSLSSCLLLWRSACLSPPWLLACICWFPSPPPRLCLVNLLCIISFIQPIPASTVSTPIKNSPSLVTLNQAILYAFQGPQVLKSMSRLIISASVIIRYHACDGA